MQPIRPVVIPHTYEDYAAVPSDGRRLELIDGDFEVTPASAPRHQNVSRRLQHELMYQLEDPGIASIFDAPIDVILSDHDVLQPDLVILAAARSQFVMSFTPGNFVQSLAVEDVEAMLRGSDNAFAFPFGHCSNGGLERC